MIKLPSVELREAYEALAEKDAKIAGRDAEIARLKKLLSERDGQSCNVE